MKLILKSNYNPQVVLYHMFEAYNEMGVSNIEIVDLVSGVASFFVVALGGTLIGE